MKKNLLFTFLCLMATTILLQSCCGSNSGALSQFEKLKFVQNDLDSLMQIYSSKMGDQTQYQFNCKLDSDLADKSFAYKISDGSKVQFSGASEIEVSHAVYTFLGELGFLFDITGTSVQEELTSVAAISQDTLIIPKVKYRGIRQHVNFPMDISSYSLPDAEKYIDDLLRMRFNKLTIHSYPGQWYESQVADTTMYAGHFFYGDPHYQYNSELLRKAVPENDTVFCIPEAEKLRHNPQQLSDFATNWMRGLIEHAKERGLYVQLSFETRTDSSQKALADLESVYNTYPMVDALELITEETGGWGKACTRDEVNATLSKYFTPEIASNPTVQKPIKDKQSDLNYLYTQIGVHAAVINEVKEKNLYPDIELKVGIYCSMDYCTGGAYRLARLSTPDTKVCIMPSHGSDGTAKSIAYFIENEEDLINTELYSWIEFDGLMYLLQNSANGNEKLFQELDKVDGGKGLTTSILYNHWRTSENRTASRYVAEATIKNLSPESFYATYARRLGIKDVAKYDKAMKIINEVDSYSKGGMPNIGFCWMGAWRNMGKFLAMKPENIEKARAMHLEAGELFAELIKDAEEGSVAYDYLKFLGNRAVCTIQYLDAFKYATSIQKIKGQRDNTMSAAGKKEALEILNHSLLMFEEYMKTHSEMMPDRGCQGTLVSVWNAPMRGLKLYRALLGGTPIDELPVSKKAVDAPPLPIFVE